ncbi:hypothetical protein KAU39_03500 [bacterium]|nr:hypothetical protein [bacterium]
MSIFPDPQKQGDIQFLFAKKLSYSTRMKFVLFFIVIGLLIQLFFHFWFGLIFLGLGVSLSFIKGYFDKTIVVSKGKWTQVTPDEYKKVKTKQEQLKKWDTDAFDITNPLGVVVFILVALIGFAVWFGLYYILEELKLALYWTIDVFVLFGFHWITGIRTFLKRDKLIIKINSLEKIMAALANPSDIQVLPMLSTREIKGKGRIPDDARLMIRFLNAPECFLGMQVQLSMNNVQGKDYPYLYCVLIAKKEAGFFLKKEQLLENPPKKIVFELQASGDVDVLVIRQYTTKRSGYHTNLKKAVYIVRETISLTRRLLKNNPPGKK